MAQILSENTALLPLSVGPVARRRAQLDANRAEAEARASGDVVPLEKHRLTNLDIIAAPQNDAAGQPDWLLEMEASVQQAEPAQNGSPAASGCLSPAGAPATAAEAAETKTMGPMAKRRAQQAAKKEAQRRIIAGEAQPSTAASSSNRNSASKEFRLEVQAWQDKILRDNMDRMEKVAKVVWNGEEVESPSGPLQLRRLSETPASLSRAGKNHGNQLAALLIETRNKGRSVSFTLGSVGQAESTAESFAMVYSRVEAGAWRKKAPSRTAQFMLQEVNTKSFHGDSDGESDTDKPEPKAVMKGKQLLRTYSNKAISKLKSMDSSKHDPTPEPALEDNEQPGTSGTNGRAVRSSDRGDILTLERYKFPVNIYEGEMSTVFVAVDTVERDPVVLRRYTIADLSTDLSVRLGREIQLLERLVDAGNFGVVDYRGTFRTDEHIYIVTENCTEGDLLRDLTLSRGNSLHEERVRTVIMPQLLAALKYLHSHRVVHCDVRPENVFQTSKGKIKLGDFHLAVDLNLEAGNQRRGMVDYMAPEMLVLPAEGEPLTVRGRRRLSSAYTEKVDIWQVGILAYELLTGSTPFDAEEINLSAAMILWGNVESYPLYISENGVDFISKCLTKNPRKRPDAATLLKHPWVLKSVSHTAEEMETGEETEAANKQQGLLRSLTSLAHRKSNEAERGSRDQGLKDEEGQEGVSAGGDGLLMRGFKSIAVLLGMRREPSDQEKREGESSETIGATAPSDTEHQLVDRMASAVDVVDEIVLRRSLDAGQRPPEPMGHRPQPKAASAVSSLWLSTPEVIEEEDEEG